ncbi:hypothetical protein ASD01_11515 [Ensifer sp. Root423]|uniref:hypothetical protein n=1 Tax=Ensifer sp. Root423 TaxID=1736534 RepID=UPI0007146F4C|nr:hypothetical protein [Ensifer sp. Root423]KQX06198.1 hypothetical protein ASD01_11515 [Ensifer sp. Root423]
MSEIFVWMIGIFVLCSAVAGLFGIARRPQRGPESRARKNDGGGDAGGVYAGDGGDCGGGDGGGD